ncbi:MAG: hypothetical protein PVF73_02915 [Bacteroidales bacterium]|jgi:hypothetical protein
MKNNRIAFSILASALVWGAVLVASSVILKGTPYRSQMFNVILGGIAFHMLFIWGPLGNRLRKTEQEETESEE